MKMGPVLDLQMWGLLARALGNLTMPRSDGSSVKTLLSVICFPLLK